MFVVQQRKNPLSFDSYYAAMLTGYDVTTAPVSELTRRSFFMDQTGVNKAQPW
jgi:hypothetical protein